MKMNNDKKTSIEQVMSDYLINLSQFYKNGQSLTEQDNYNNNDKKKNKKDEKINISSHNNIFLKYRKDNSNSEYSRTSISDDLCDIENNKSAYYEQIMNNIFPFKERKIFYNIQKIIKDENSYLYAELDEYLYCYLYILAIKKTFYDIIAQKKIEYEIEKYNENKKKIQDIYMFSPNNEEPSLNINGKYLSCKSLENYTNLENYKTWKTSIKHEVVQRNFPNNIKTEYENEEINKIDKYKIPSNESLTYNSHFNEVGISRQNITCNNNNEHDENLKYDNISNTNSYENINNKTKSIIFEKEDNNDIKKIKKIKQEKRHEKKQNDRFNKNYIIYIFEILKKNKLYWIIPLTIISSVYIYYKLKETVYSFVYNYSMNMYRHMVNIFANNNSNKINNGNNMSIYKDYKHFFHNINKNNIKTIWFDPSNNTFNYFLNKNPGKNTNMIIFNQPKPSNIDINNNDVNNNMHTVYYHDYIMKYLLKNKIYENVEIKLYENINKSSVLDIIKRYSIDVLTYVFSLGSLYYIYGKKLSPFNLDCKIEKKYNNMNSLNEIVLNSETKRDVKSILFIMHFSKLFININNDHIYINHPSNSSILFTGETGTGKTLLAKTIAKELNADFIHISGSSFIELYIGNGASKIRNLFKTAKNNKNPVVVFIDEIDSIGLNRNANDISNNQNHEYAQTLNQLLIEIDSIHEYNNEQLILSYIDGSMCNDNNYEKTLNFVKKKIFQYFLEQNNCKYNINKENKMYNYEGSFNENDGYEMLQYYLNNNFNLKEIEDLFNLKKFKTKKYILLIAATNRYAHLDPVLIRSKRFDKIIHFKMPNLYTRKKLFDFYIDKYISKSSSINIRKSQFGNRISRYIWDANTEYENIDTKKINNSIYYKKKCFNSSNFTEKCFEKYIGYTNIRSHIPIYQHIGNNILTFKQWPIFGKKYNNNYIHFLKTINKMKEKYMNDFIDTYTFSILTHLFNCADIDQLISSIKINKFKKNNPYKITRNMNSILAESIISILHKKFLYDKHVHKIINRKDYIEYNTQANNPINNLNFLYNNIYSEKNYEIHLSKFVEFCDEKCYQKIYEKPFEPKLTLDDLNFFSDFKKIPNNKSVSSEESDFMQNNNFLYIHSILKNDKNYHLPMLWKSIEHFFISIYTEYTYLK